MALALPPRVRTSSFPSIQRASPTVSGDCTSAAVIIRPIASNDIQRRADASVAAARAPGDPRGLGRAPVPRLRKRIPIRTPAPMNPLGGSPSSPPAINSSMPATLRFPPRSRALGQAAFALCAALALPSRSAGAGEPNFLPASDSRFRYEGRLDFADPAAPVVIWQASRVAVDFGGDTLALRFSGASD